MKSYPPQSQRSSVAQDPVMERRACIKVTWSFLGLNNMGKGFFVCRMVRWVTETDK